MLQRCCVGNPKKPLQTAVVKLIEQIHRQQDGYIVFLHEREMNFQVK